MGLAHLPRPPAESKRGPIPTGLVVSWGLVLGAIYGAIAAVAALVTREWPTSLVVAAIVSVTIWTSIGLRHEKRWAWMTAVARCTAALVGCWLIVRSAVNDPNPNGTDAPGMAAMSAVGSAAYPFTLLVLLVVPPTIRCYVLRR